MIHRPRDGVSSDPLFGPYISVIPQDFESHPLTWLWKERRNSDPGGVENKLVNVLPERIHAKLGKIMDLYDQDWLRVRDYLESNPSVLDSAKDLNALESDYLWGWLNGLSLSYFRFVFNIRMLQLTLDVFTIV